LKVKIQYIMRNALKGANLGSLVKVSKSALTTKNVKIRLDFAWLHKDWTMTEWILEEGVFLVMTQRPIISTLMVWVGIGLLLKQIFQHELLS